VLITTGAVACSIVFEKRLWCRWLCPIGKYPIPTVRLTGPALTLHLASLGCQLIELRPSQTSLSLHTVGMCGTDRAIDTRYSLYCIVCTASLDESCNRCSPLFLCRQSIHTGAMNGLFAKLAMTEIRNRPGLCAAAACTKPCHQVSVC
jgi:hypothetical protein